MTPHAPPTPPLHRVQRAGCTTSRKRPLLCRKSRAGSGSCSAGSHVHLAYEGPEATRRGRIRHWGRIAAGSRHDGGPRTASRTMKAPDSPPAKQPFVFHSRRSRPRQRGGKGRASALTALKQVTARQGVLSAAAGCPDPSPHGGSGGGRRSLHTSVSAGCSEHVTPRRSEHPGFQKAAAALSRR